MSPALRGKRALVTGGGRGIGAAVVKRLAREGADVAFTYVSKPEEATRVAAAATQSGGRAVAFQADSADPGAVVGAVERTVRDLGSLDILVNNAGIASMAPIDPLSPTEFEPTLAVNGRARSLAVPRAVQH